MAETLKALILSDEQLRSHTRQLLTAAVEQIRRAGAAPGHRHTASSWPLFVVRPKRGKSGGRRQEPRASMYGMSASMKPREADGGTSAKASWKDS